MWEMGPPLTGDDWVELTASPLPTEDALAWVTVPACGASVLFSGTVRDHADGRPGVSELDYEAYPEQVVPRLARIAAEARRRWPALGRVALIHRTGVLAVGDCSVLVVVSAPHRGDAFDAARWAIDAIKSTVPIWKRETWEGGSAWGSQSRAVAEVGQ